MGCFYRGYSKSLLLNLQLWLLFGYFGFLIAKDKQIKSYCIGQVIGFDYYEEIRLLLVIEVGKSMFEIQMVLLDVFWCFVIFIDSCEWVIN